jgi:hypothetical protein
MQPQTWSESDPEQTIVASETASGVQSLFSLAAGHSRGSALLASAVAELRKLGYELLVSTSALALAHRFSVAGVSDFVSIDGGTSGAAEGITQGQLIPIDA